MVWLAAALAVGVLGYLAAAISDAAPDRRVGIVLMAIAAAAVVTAGLLVVGSGTGALLGSLLVSVSWLLAGAFAIATMRFTSDRIVLGALPAAIAVITALLALYGLRDSDRDRAPGP